MNTHRVTIHGELPDLNQIIDAAKDHYGKYSRIKKLNTEAVAWSVKQLPHMERINLTCHWYCRNKRKDKDNVAVGVKFILDGLVLAGRLDNDGWSQVGNITHRYYVDKHNPRIELEIEVVA